MGGWLYSVYRRTRYLRYVRKVRKQRTRALKRDESREETSYRENLARQKRRERKEERQRRTDQAREARQERRAHKAALITHRREQRELDRQRNRQLKEEKRKERAAMKERLKEKTLLDREESALLKQKASEVKRSRRRRIRALRPYLLRRRLRESIRSIRSIDRQRLKKWFWWMIHLAENKTERNRFLKITLNSLSLFVLAYLALYISGELITLYAAQTFEYKTILFYYKIYYNIDSDQWTPDAVKILYSIKPLTGLVLGSVALIIYSSLRNNQQVFKVFYLWLFVHGMVMFFGSLLLGTLLNQGFGWVIAYLYYKDTGKMVFSIISIFALVVTGTAIARSFLISGNAYFNFIQRDNRRLLLLSQVVLPLLLGTVITSFMKIPNDLYFTTSEEVTYEIFKLSSIIIVLIPLVLSFSSFSTVYFDEEPRTIRFHWIYIFIFAGIYLGYRFLLTGGMEFGMQ